MPAVNDRQKGNNEDFVLGTKAADLWLYTSDACANDKIIPKKFRYTTGTSLMNDVEEICELIEGANLLDLRIPKEAQDRLNSQKAAMRKLEKMGRKISRLLESKQYPGVTPDKAGYWSRLVLTVRYMCAAWHGKDQARVAPKGDVRRR